MKGLDKNKQNFPRVDQPPVFLVGSERSGTTLLRLMLDHHPEVAFNLESEYMVSQITEDGAFPSISSYREWLVSDRVFQHSNFKIDRGLDYAGLMDDFLQQKLLCGNKRFVGATIHLAFNRIQFIWPKAKYIYLYRDGRDVASSVVNIGWAGNTYVAADSWLRAEAEWGELRKGLLDDQWIEVQYEKLISHPEDELSKICAFIGVKFSSHMFNYVNDSTYYLPDQRLNYQWKRKMGEQELCLLESKIGTQLLSRGYEMSGYPAIVVSPIRSQYLALHSKAHKFLWRAKHYGAALTLGSAIARYLGARRLNERLKAKFDRITDSLLK